MKQSHWVCIFLVSIPGSFALADEVDIPNQFTSGTPAVAAEVNENFSAVEVAVDDNAAQITALTTTVQDLEGEVGVLQGEVAALEAENASLSALLQGLELETTLYPAIDTLINLNHDVPQADAEQLNIGDFGPFETYGLFQFDLTGIPAGAIVVDAELRLWKTDDPAADIDLCVQRVTSAWDESVSYSTAPAQESTCLSTVTLEQQEGLYYWTGIADLVQTWVDGSNFGLALALTGPDVTGVKNFYSNEGGIYKPELKVRYRPLP